MVDLTEYLWILWLVFILVCIIIELLTLEFTFLMIGIGSLGGLAANLLDLDWWLQILIAALLSVLLLVLIRPILLRLLKQGGDPTPSNIAAVIGQSGRVLTTVGDTVGLVKLANGETWTARLAAHSPATSLDPGQTITVSAIEGSTALVLPQKGTPHAQH
jgi:membrane protein implicated in regulation of membrane protease activity